MRKTPFLILKPRVGLLLFFAFCALIHPCFARADAENGTFEDAQSKYQVASSHWAVGFRVALNSVPFSSAVGDSYQFFGEWVIPYQQMGIFSLGGHLGAFPINTQNTTGSYIPYPNFESAMGGFQFRYQLKFFKQQLFIPTVSGEWDFYRFVIGSDRAAAVGPTLGANIGFMINLGWLDRRTAMEDYQAASLTRTYFTFEVHPLQIANYNLNLSGNLFYFGVRFEFE